LALKLWSKKINVSYQNGFSIAKRTRCLARTDSGQILTLQNIITSDSQAIGIPFLEGCDENEVGFL
jgi:hypothetical protein